MSAATTIQPTVYEPVVASPPSPVVFSDDDDILDQDSICEDHDGAQAVLQPAISAAASHLTSPNTPAAEKTAALEAVQGGGLFDPLPGDCATDGQDDGGDATPTSTLSPAANNRGLRRGAGEGLKIPSLSLGTLPARQPSQPALPSPWRAGTKAAFVDESRTPQSRSLLETAFGPTRQRRSRSTGQDALRRLQKAFPSLSPPSHLIPSLPTSFLSNLTDSKTATPKPNRVISSQQHRQPPPSSTTPTRPPALRRVTSDESVLYHSLSRASSLGDDDRFQDVRAMVNIRLMAIRDSLPEVPNFKMPSLAKIQAASRKSTMSLNAMFSSEPNLPPMAETEQDSDAIPKDDPTALDRVLEELTGDLVLLGGYRGSVLRSAEAPHQQLWAPVKLGLNMRKANLEVGLDEQAEEAMEQTIIPSGMLKHIGPIDISRKLFKKLKSCENARTGKLRVWDYGYDWRLSPHLSSGRLEKFLEGLPSNHSEQTAESRGATVIAHSLGGVITRHVVNRRPELFAGVLYAGAPQRCINILGPFRNGDAVLFNEKLLTAAVNFSIRTSFVFLPDDGFCFINKETGEEYPVDFHNADHWVKYHLSPCVQTPLPPYNKPQQSTSPLSALLPNAFLRPRGDSKSEKKHPAESVAISAGVATQNVQTDHHRTPPANGNPGGYIATESPSEISSPTIPTSPATSTSYVPVDPEQRRYYEYLQRTLAKTRQFRTELAHIPAHRDNNAYPPFAVLYGKTIPTVYAAQVSGRDAIRCTDAYDDLLFRAGDGVVLAKEAMPPDGYSIVRGGRVSTERGHLTMLGDMPAVGRALEALMRGRRKGIGLGKDTATNEPAKKR